MKTSKILTFIVVLTLLSGELFSQASFAIGPKAGVTFSRLRGNDAGNINGRTGFAGGLFFNIVPGSSGVFAISPEIMFQNRGATNEIDDVDITQEIKIDYMTIPIPFKIRIPIDETFYPHIFAGPEFAFLVNDEYSDNGNGQFDDIRFRRGDVSAIFGAGLDIESENLFFNVEMRYGMGALNIDKGENKIELKTSHFTIFAGIGIRFGG